MGTRRRSHKMMMGGGMEPQPGNRTTSATSSAPSHHHHQTSSNGAGSGTRLCLKNLPPRYTDRDLRNWLLNPKHYGGRNNLPTLTDVKVLKNRRMAFCGFVTPEQAANVLHCLDRTYCGTCRLTVEYALPKKKPELSSDEKQQEELHNDKTADGHVQPSSVPLSATVSAPPKGKFWSNDDDLVESQQLANENFQAEVGAEPQVSSDDAESSDSDSSSASVESDADDADPLKNQDLDFLRSKQVAVLDLEEDGNEPQNEIAPEKKDNEEGDDSDNDSSSTSSSTSASTTTTDSSSSTYDEFADENKDKNKGKASFPVAPDATTTMSAAPTVEVEKDKDEVPEGSERADPEQQPNRLFVRNLPFSTTADDLKAHFEPFGRVDECHLPLTESEDQNRGYAFVTLESAEAATEALEQLDGTDFQGRLLHILPARRQPPQQQSIQHDASTAGNGGYRGQKEQQRQEQADKNRAGWSASFVRGDAVVDHLSSRLGLSKGSLLAIKDDMSAGEAAVRLALGETAVIEENRAYFADHGIDLEALVSLPKKTSNDGSNNAIVDAGTDRGVKRSTTSLLVKNLPNDTTQEDLLKLFAKAGSTPVTILLPPSRTLALVEFEHASAAKAAFRGLAYRRFKSVPVYLEWAPLTAKGGEKSNKVEESKTKDDENDDVDEALTANGPIHTLYVKNLSFATSEDRLYQEFSRYAKDVRAVRIPQKVAPFKRLRTDSTESPVAEKTMSMGYGFVEFGSIESVRKLLKTRQGMIVDGHTLELALSGKRDSPLAKSISSNKKDPSSKLMVRNVPFQATRTDLLKLFGSFGQLKKVRLPKKFDGTPRGFAFVEYTTSRDATTAKATLSRTHLYGRHLVLEWADEDDSNVDHKSPQLDHAPVLSNKRTRFE